MIRLEPPDASYIRQQLSSGKSIYGCGNKNYHKPYIHNSIESSSNNIKYVEREVKVIDQSNNFNLQFV